MKHILFVLVTLICSNSFSQNKIEKKPLTIDGSEFESIEVSRAKAEIQIQVKDSIEKMIMDSISLEEAKLMLLEQENANRILDSLNNLLPLEAAPSEEIENFIEAREFYNKAIEKFLSKEYLQSIEFINKTLLLNPTYYDAIDLKASINALEGNYKEALEGYTKAISLDSTKLTAITNRASLKIELQDYRGAINDLTKSIHNIERLKAMPYIRDKDGIEKEDYSKYRSDLYSQRANAKLNLKQYNALILDCNKALQINKENKQAFYFRGIAKIELNQKESGCLDLSKAGELGQMEAYEAIKEYCNK
jgi:tetratricopeptide (TPR) repeat protein